MQTSKPAIGLDIGGTKIAGAVVDPTGAVLMELLEPTPEESDAESVTAVLLGLIERLRAEHDVAAIGVGAAGIVEWPAGKMLWAPNNAYRANIFGVAPILPATFGGDAGKIGAALLALDHLA